MDKNKFNLSISGNISRDEIEELKDELKELDVFPNKLETFSAEIPEWINLAFRHFDTITFLRDFILSSLLASTISKIKNWAKAEKGKEIKGVWVVYIFNIEGVNFSLNIMSDVDHLENIFKEVKNILTIDYVLENIKPNSIVSFSWDEKENKVICFV